MRISRDSVVVALVWVVLTVVLEVVLWVANIYPGRGSEEAEHLDAAFRLLTAYAVPVFTFVIVVMGYSVLRFRSREGREEGPPIFGNRLFSTSWFVGSAALVTLLFVHPGLTGVLFLQREPEGELLVKVTAAQWHWHIEYPEYGLEIKSRPVGWERMGDSQAMALPVGKRIKFEITSVDVIHSFWIPAFRVKQDAVPGVVHTLFVTPTEVGEFGADSAFRVQCAELCGAGHPYMNMPLVVMEEEEFLRWVEEQKKRQEMGGMEMEMDMKDMKMEEKDEHEDKH